MDLPFGILPKTEKGRHYEGWYVGGGLTYGYQWLLSEHLNLEGSIGLGYIYSPYKLYGRCDKCLDKDHRNYVEMCIRDRVSDAHKDELKAFFDENGIGYAKIGYPAPELRKIIIKKEGFEHEFDIDALRDDWYKTSRCV